MRDFVLQMVAVLRPASAGTPCSVGGELEEIMIGCFAHRLGARDARNKAHQIGRRVGRSAHFARIAVLILRAAIGAFALDEPIRQEHLLHRIVELLDRASRRSGPLAFRLVDSSDSARVLRRMRRVVVVELDQESRRNPACAPSSTRSMSCSGVMPSLLGAQHDRRAVRVVRADEMDSWPHIFWKRTQMSAWMYSTRCPKWMRRLRTAARR